MTETLHRNLETTPIAEQQGADRQSGQIATRRVPITADPDQVLQHRAPANDVVVYDPQSLAAHHRARIQALKARFTGPGRCAAEPAGGPDSPTAIRGIAFRLRRAAFGCGASDIVPDIDCHR